MKVLQKSLAVLGFTTMFLAQPTICYACSCAPGSEAQHFERAEAVFVGVATSRHDPNQEGEIMSTGDPIDWSFDVEATTKGSISDPQDIRSARGGATCGFSFNVGERYKVYAFRGEDGALWTNICSGTRSATAEDMASPDPAAPTRAEPGELPETGPTILWPLSTGLVSLFSGVFLLAKSKRTRSHPR